MKTPWNFTTGPCLLLLGLALTQLIHRCDSRYVWGPQTVACLTAQENNHCHYVNSPCYKYRKKLYKCEDGTVYHCLRNVNTGMFMEDCFKAVECPMGTEPLVEFIPHSRVICRDCKDLFRYNPYNSTLSNMTSECQETKKPCSADVNKFLCKQESARDNFTKPFLCRCDVRRGYGRYGNFDRSQPACSNEQDYNCEKVCRGGNDQDVLLNGYRCAPTCPEGYDRTDEYSDECIQMSTTTPIPGTTTLRHVTRNVFRTTTQPPVRSTQEKSPTTPSHVSDSTESLPDTSTRKREDVTGMKTTSIMHVSLSVGIGAALLIIGFVAGLFCRKYCPINCKQGTASNELEMNSMTGRAPGDTSQADNAANAEPVDSSQDENAANAETEHLLSDENAAPGDTSQADNAANAETEHLLSDENAAPGDTSQADNAANAETEHLLSDENAAPGDTSQADNAANAEPVDSSQDENAANAETERLLSDDNAAPGNTSQADNAGNAETDILLSDENAANAETDGLLSDKNADTVHDGVIFYAETNSARKKAIEFKKVVTNISPPSASIELWEECRHGGVPKLEAIEMITKTHRYIFFLMTKDIDEDQGHKYSGGMLLSHFSDINQGRLFPIWFDNDRTTFPSRFRQYDGLNYALVCSQEQDVKDLFIQNFKTLIKRGRDTMKNL